MNGASRHVRAAWWATGFAFLLVVIAPALATPGASAASAPSDPVSSPTPAANAGYLTILFGRAMWVTANQCSPLPGAVDLDTVARRLALVGRTATAAVVVTRVKESTRACWKPYALQASWDDLAGLHDHYGWSMISNGMTHNDITKMTVPQQFDESCGSLAPLAAHGHVRASGLYAYGGNDKSVDVQANVVSTCFSYGRRYIGRTNVRGQLTPPWFQNTGSVLGGRCHDVSLPCATVAVRNDRVYWLPEKIISLLPANGDQWSVIQFYRLVSGRTTTGSWRWDCTAADAHAHWTSDPELYCYEDFQRVVAAVPASVQNADPMTVATAWGR